MAVDLGVRTTKAVNLQRRGERFALVNYTVVETPVTEGPLNGEALTEHLQKVCREVGLGRQRKVTLAIGVADSFIRQIEAPMMEPENLRQMLKFNSKAYLQQELPDHVFDCHVCGAAAPAEGAKPGTVKQKVIVGAAPRALIDGLQKAAKEAGVVADQIVPGLLGPPNAFELAEPDAFLKDVVALVEIGFRNTIITILDSGEIKLTRVVSIGGDRLTTGLAEAMSISYEEAENIKVGMPGEVQQNLEALLYPLGRELRASIDFFEHQEEKTVSEVFVSGGSARSEFLLQALQNELMVPCKSWNPVKTMQVSVKPDKAGELEELAPQLTVAVGAAACGF